MPETQQNIMDSFALLIAQAGAEDARAGRPINPKDDQFWYRVGYYIARDQITPEEAMAYAKAEEPDAQH